MPAKTGLLAVGDTMGKCRLLIRSFGHIMHEEVSKIYGPPYVAIHRRPLQ